MPQQLRVRNEGQASELSGRHISRRGNLDRKQTFVNEPRRCADSLQGGIATWIFACSMRTENNDVEDWLSAQNSVRKRRRGLHVGKYARAASSCPVAVYEVHA
jgi:hypothetical protein